MGYKGSVHRCVHSEHRSRHNERQLTVLQREFNAVAHITVTGRHWVTGEISL